MKVIRSEIAVAAEVNVAVNPPRLNSADPWRVWVRLCGIYSMSILYRCVFKDEKVSGNGEVLVS